MAPASPASRASAASRGSGRSRVWLPQLRTPDVSARHMASLVEEKAWRALYACHMMRVFLSSLLLLLALSVLSVVFQGMSVKMIVGALRGGKDAGSLMAFMVGSLSTVLLQSSSETIYLAGTMVSSQQLDIHKGILLAIGTTVGASFLPLLVAMMPCDRLHLTRAVWGVASFQLMKLFALLSCALLLVPAEMLSHGQLLGFTQVLVDHMGEIGINYVNPATWVVKPLSDALVKINQWRLKAFVLGPQEVSYVAAARCLSNSCGYSCLSDQVQDTWQSLDAQQYKALDVCSEFFGTANCTGDRPWCLLSGNMFWDVVVEQPNLFEVGGVVSGFICGLVFLSGASVFFLRDLSKMGRCRKVVEKVVAVPSALASFGVMVFTLLLMHDSVFVVCVLTPLCGLGLLPAPKMMCWAMAAEVGAALALIARGATELPFAEGVVQMAWVQLFCSILAVLLTALPCVRRLACHCGLLCATASHEFLIFLVVWAAGIPAVLAGMFAVSLLWDSSPSFTVCILLVVLPLVMATVIWCCLRSEWLLPIDVREQVREECERCEVATRPATAVQSPTSPNRLSPPGLRPVSPHRDRAESATPATQCVSPPRAANISPQFRSPVPVINVRSPPSNQTQMKTPSLSASPANEMPHLEVLEDGEKPRGPKITAPKPVMPVVPRSSRPSGSESTSSSADRRMNYGDFTPFPYDVTTMPGGGSTLRPMSPPPHESEESGHGAVTCAALFPEEQADPASECPGPDCNLTGAGRPRHAIPASPEPDRDRDRTTWGSSLQVLTSRLRVSSTPISACGSEESC